MQNMLRCITYSWFSCRQYSYLIQIYLRHMHTARVRNKHLYRIWHCISPYKVHIRILESTEKNISALLLGLEYVINISYVDDTEVFKVCLDYWNTFVLELFQPHRSLEYSAAKSRKYDGIASVSYASASTTLCWYHVWAENSYDFSNG